MRETSEGSHSSLFVLDYFGFGRSTELGLRSLSHRDANHIQTVFFT